jgi:hypothetical protein
LRHLASVLNAAVVSRFNTKDAAGFMFLRFITAVVSIPADYRPGLEVLGSETTDVLIPGSSLLQTAANLVPFDGWNARLEKLVPWVLAVADLPVYAAPSQAVVGQALSRVLAAVSGRFDNFRKKCEELGQQGQGKHPIRWNLAACLCGFFEESQ